MTINVILAHWFFAMEILLHPSENESHNTWRIPVEYAQNFKINVSIQEPQNIFAEFLVLRDTSSAFVNSYGVNCGATREIFGNWTGEINYTEWILHRAHGGGVCSLCNNLYWNKMFLSNLSTNLLLIGALQVGNLQSFFNEASLLRPMRYPLLDRMCAKFNSLLPSPRLSALPSLPFSLRTQRWWRTY